MKKQFLLIGTILFIIGAIGVGTTVAMLFSRSRTLENTFTYGEIELVLEESTGSDYLILPGVTHKKDPRITVLSGSEECWLFCKIEDTQNFSLYMTYSVADGWSKLDGENNVWYRKVEAKPYDHVFPILSEDKVTVKDTLTKQQLAAIDHNPTLTFYAYAIQTHSIPDAASAWQIITQEQEEH